MSMDEKEKANLPHAEIPHSTGESREKSPSEHIHHDKEQVSEEPLSSRVRRREIRRGSIPFEEAYQRETVYLDRSLKPKLEQLVEQQRRSKTSLINEAINDLLIKYRQM